VEHGDDPAEAGVCRDEHDEVARAEQREVLVPAMRLGEVVGERLVLLQGRSQTQPVVHRNTFLYLPRRTTH
jgi:dihydrodipicolinate reductase